MKLKVTTVGNSLGIVLPKDLLANLRLNKGDYLYAAEIPGGVKLTPYDEKFEAQMAVAERIMRRRRDVLRKLAQ
ncbi:MAG: AbrB/MazE/SpoVT family DNA-binding domain-containing protein [Gammaproteobacteria bacterium]|jgi:putative addiction module antidote|nr:AbrB/MazE/SpoVT family DNA-binding domain-containing protein [Gammaproteobacteria bacterium]